MKRFMVTGVAIVLGCALMVNPAAVESVAAQAKPAAGKAAASKSAEKKVEKSAKHQDIERFLKVSGAGELGVQVLGQMIQMFRQQMPNVPQQFWDEFIKEADANSLVELIIPVYDKHFTHEDIKGLIAFYETPVGKKLIAVQPAITRDSQIVGEKWGMELGALVGARLQEKGYQ